MKSRATVVSVLLGLALVLLLPQFVYPALALDILLWGLFAVAVDLLLGYGGLLSFGHAAFWGVGGYATALFSRAVMVPFPIAVLVGVLAAILISVPIGWLSIRRRGIYFAMVTLAFAQMVFYIVNEWRDVTGGENGVQGVPRYLFGFNLEPAINFYYAALPLFLLGIWFAYRVVHSPFGRVLVSIRDNEARAQALGYPTNRYKLLAFVISAGLAGLAGSLFSLGHGFASLDMVHWSASGQAVLMTILGGIGTLWGSLLGAGLVLILRDWLSSRTDAYDVLTGAIFIIVVLGFRRGLWVTLRELPVRVRRASARRGEPAAPATNSRARVDTPERGA